MKKYRDSRYIAIVVLRPLKTITQLRRGQGVTYSMTLYDNLNDYGWAVIVYVNVIAFHRITARCTIVQNTVLRLHVVRPSDCLSVCDVGEYGAHGLKILETTHGQL